MNGVEQSCQAQRNVNQSCSAHSRWEPGTVEHLRMEQICAEPSRPAQPHLEQTIRRSREAYRNHMLHTPVSSFEFLIGQILTVRSRYWIMQLILLMVVVVSLILMQQNRFKINSYEYFAIMAPLTVICSIPELWRNLSSGSYEVENTTFYDLRKVYFARLVLVGMMDLILLTVLVIGVSNISNGSVYDSILYFFVPFNLNCSVCFFLLCSPKRLHSQSVAIGCCGMIGIGWYTMMNQLRLYEWIQKKVWIGLLAGSFLFLSYVCVRSIKMSRFYCEMEG